MMTTVKTQNGGQHSPRASWYNDLFNIPVSQGGTTLWPAVNIAENGEAFMVEVAAPGYEKNDFNIKLEEGMLTIASQQKEAHSAHADRKYLRREFGKTVFERTFSLPNTVDANKIQARLLNGVLQLYIPKKEEAKPRVIQVVDVA